MIDRIASKLGKIQKELHIFKQLCTFLCIELTEDIFDTKSCYKRKEKYFCGISFQIL